MSDTLATLHAAPPAAAPCASLAPDARWWPGVAAQVLALAGAGQGAPRDLHRVLVIVPSLAQAPLLRTALFEALGGQACIAPRILSLEQWTGVESGGGARQQAELYAALGQSPWVRERFGAQPGALWALARDVALLGDELTLAACGAEEAYAGRWRAVVAQHFTQRAAAAGEVQAQLVLALWRAGSRAGARYGAARLRAALEERIAGADGPLLWLVPQGAQAWQEAACRSYTTHSGHAAVLLGPDLPAFAAAHPWLGLAWPELFEPPSAALPEPAGAAASLARRARALPADAAQPPLTILRCLSLEEEACVAAQWTLERLQEGCERVALVALDRLTARRVRALLERAGVALQDSSGWKLSTTSAAAALVHWIELVQADFPAAALLDWLQSPFVLAQEPGKRAFAGEIARIVRKRGLRCGLAPLRLALAREAEQGDAGVALQDAARVLGQLAELARQWLRPGPLGRYLGLLEASLAPLGLRAPLAEDPIGRAVIDALAQLHEQLVGSDLHVDLPEFRALLADYFEQRGAAVNERAGGVLLTTLAGTRLRPFDAVLLIGADADHLPAAPSAGGLLANRVRRDLGLRTDAQRDREQGLDLALLLAQTPRVAATWRVRDGDEPHPLSPLLERLCLLAELAGREPPVRAGKGALLSVAAQPLEPRAPRAPQQLPQRLSASAYQDLIDCPYRFFALRMLGLREESLPAVLPDKRDFGVLLHAVLHAFHSRAPAGDEDAPHALARAQALVEEVFAPALEQQPALLAYRQRLFLLLPGYLAWARAARAEGWRWHAGEEWMQRDITLAGGQAVRLQGVIDRVEVRGGAPQETDAQQRPQFRLIDYKTRDAGSLRRAQREAGEHVQLLFYALLLGLPLQEAAYLSLQRPPRLREPLDKVAILVAAPGDLQAQAIELEQRLVEHLERIAAGAALPANGVESICRRCELRSLCRHGYVTPAPAPEPA